MTDETPDAAAAVDTLEPEPAVPVPVEPAGERVSYWHRPNVERYVLPLLTPVVVVIGLAMFVLNISRVFLAGHGDVPVIVGSVITVVILVGATILSNSAGLRSQTIILTTAGFVFTVLLSGWLVLGHSQEKGEGDEPLAASGPVTGAPVTIDALASIKFAPETLTKETGLYSLTLNNVGSGSHTLAFDNPATRFAELLVNSAGESQTGRVFFGEPAEYTFFCTIPGHRAAGMEGAITVTGAPMTFEEAEAEGEPAAGAGAEGEAPA